MKDEAIEHFEELMALGNLAFVRGRMLNDSDSANETVEEVRGGQRQVHGGRRSKGIDGGLK